VATPSLLIAYHFVIAGRFRLTIEGDRTIEVRAGEVVLMPRKRRSHTGQRLGSSRR